MDYLPLFHKLVGRRCLIVGGGQVAFRKLRTLCDAGAVITVVAPQVDSAILTLADEYVQLNIQERPFAPADLDDAVLVIVATDDKVLNANISKLAQAQKIDVNVVDQPELCTVIFPAIVDRSPVQVAISTGGASPVLARLLRGQIEALLPARLGKLAELARRYRDKAKATLRDTTARRVFWESVLQDAVPEQVYAENMPLAASMLESRLANAEQISVGEVYLVGGGPGDPDLLTFRALRLMQQADVVLYDRLISPQVLDMVRRDAERIFVGKTAGSHPVTQANINDKLVELARQGNRVLRLKGGDPFIFGRGGEEIEKLADHGVRFQVVPGITAASGCASYAGIPLTHRDYAQSVRFITGHKQDKRLDLDWTGLVNANETLVFYMSLNGLEDICKNLIKYGMGSDTPAALVENGTLRGQRVFTGTLLTLAKTVRENDAQAPTLLIVGRVVGLRARLNWFRSSTER